VVKPAPRVLPAVPDGLHLDNVEAERRLLRVDGEGAVELLDAFGKDVQQEQ
jgi:hypothetical protein